MRKFLSLLLVTVLCVALLSNTAFAMEQEVTEPINTEDVTEGVTTEVLGSAESSEFTTPSETGEGGQPIADQNENQHDDQYNDEIPSDGEIIDDGEPLILNLGIDLDETPEVMPLLAGAPEGATTSELAADESPDDATPSELATAATLSELASEDATLSELSTSTVEVSSFPELQQAAASAPADGSEFTIIITSDITTASDEGAVVVSAGQNIVIRDNGQPRIINRTGNRCAEVFHVDEGGSLTLARSEAGSLTISGAGYQDGNYDNKKKGVVSVLGSFNLDGADIKDFTLRTYYSAAVYVAGNGTFTMTSGSITGFTSHNQVCSPVFVWENGDFIMDGGRIADNWIAPEQLDTAAVRIESFKGHSSFTMNGGEISGNKSYCGAVFAGLLNNDLFYSPSWQSDLASITINGGTISGNEAHFSGGGISVMGSGELTLNGGTITDNTAPMGGGIAVYDLYKAFESQTSLDARSFERVYNMPARLTVNGGTISGNKAIGSDDPNVYSAASDLGCGGGLYISAMNAEINKVDILDNYAEHQGGGVYVGASPYEIRIRNAVITQNTADDVGAGIWTCPTGSVVEWLVNGAAVYGNVLTDGTQQDTYYSAKIVGLAPVVAHHTEEEYDFSHNSGAVQIRCNHSQKGGGLGTNGTYIFGDDIPVTPPTTVTPPIVPEASTPSQPSVPETPVTPSQPERPTVPSGSTGGSTPNHLDLSSSGPGVTEGVNAKEASRQLDEVPKTGPEDGPKASDLVLAGTEPIATIELKSGYVLPIAQAPKADPERYLRRGLDGRYSSHGTIFADADCNMRSDNVLLYGHNMKDGGMFACLSNYEDKKYFNAHRFITLRSMTGEAIRYRVLAVFRDKVHYKDEDCFKYYKYAGKLNEKSYKEYLTNVMKKSGTRFSIPAYGTQLLTMSTCAYHTENGRLVVLAERVNG